MTKVLLPHDSVVPTHLRTHQFQFEVLVPEFVEQD